LLESLTALSGISSVVPDYNIKKDAEDLQSDKLESKKIHNFMQELVKDLVKHNPGIFKVIPESAPKAEEL